MLGTPLDRMTITWPIWAIPEPERSPRTDLQKAWADDGVVILRKQIPESLLSAYESRWMTDNGGARAVLGQIETYERPMGYGSFQACLAIDELLEIALCDQIQEPVRELLGLSAYPVVSLTNWASTELAWHFEQYLFDRTVYGYQVSVWIALDEIIETSGPFEYFRGSHRWLPPLAPERHPEIATDQIYGLLGLEPLILPIIEEEIERRNAEPERFLANRGDVLLWHNRLIHRSGRVEGLVERRSLIFHTQAVEMKDGKLRRKERPTLRPYGGDDLDRFFSKIGKL
jgi:hypothetical protein